MNTASRRSSLRANGTGTGRTSASRNAGATAAFYSMYRRLKVVERQEEEQERLEKEGK